QRRVQVVREVSVAVALLDRADVALEHRPRGRDVIVLRGRRNGDRDQENADSMHPHIVKCRDPVPCLTNSGATPSGSPSKTRSSPWSGTWKSALSRSA